MQNGEVLTERPVSKGEESGSNKVANSTVLGTVCELIVACVGL